MSLENIKLAVVGSRSFNNFYLLKESIANNYDVNKIKLIISGGAVGADSLAEKFADEFGIKTKIFLPDWKLGRSAGYLRNKQIVDECSHLIAFWDQKSRGTLYTINLAKQQNKPTIIVNF